MVKKKPETETEKCEHCGNEIAPCQTGQFCCYGKGWIHTDTQTHGCASTTDVAEPTEKPTVVSIEGIEISSFCFRDRHSLCSGGVKRFLMVQGSLTTLRHVVPCECQCHKGVF